MWSHCNPCECPWSLAALRMPECWVATITARQWKPCAGEAPACSSTRLASCPRNPPCFCRPACSWELALGGFQTVSVAFYLSRSRRAFGVQELRGGALPPPLLPGLILRGTPTWASSGLSPKVVSLVLSFQKSSFTYLDSLGASLIFFPLSPIQGSAGSWPLK